MSPDQEAIKEGFAFEKYVANILGGKCVPGSGSKWNKPLDVEVGFLLLSAKAEKDWSWAKARRYLAEALEAVFGQGKLTALVLRDKDDYNEFVVMRLEDFKELLTNREQLSVPESKGQRRRRTADTPVLLRDEKK